MLLPVSKKHQRSLSQKPHLAEFASAPPAQPGVSVTHSSLVRRGLSENGGGTRRALTVCAKALGLESSGEGRHYWASSRLV